MSRRLLTPYFLVAMLVLGTALGIGLGLSEAPSKLSVTGATVPVTPTLVVLPATNLHSGQTVTVSVSGFPPGKAYLSECVSSPDANPEGCGEQLAAQPFIVIEDGSGTGKFVVTSSAATAPLSSATEPCSSSCVLVATAGVAGVEGGGSVPRGVAMAPLRFAS